MYTMYSDTVVTLTQASEVKINNDISVCIIIVTPLGLGSKYSACKKL